MHQPARVEKMRAFLREVVDKVDNLKLRRSHSAESLFCASAAEWEKGLDKMTTALVSYPRKKMSLRRYSAADKVSFITSFAVGFLQDAMASL